MWSPKDLVKVTPCFARRPIAQPSFLKRLINCLPEMVKAIRTLMNRLGERVDMWSVEGFSSSYRGTNPEVCCGSYMVICNRVLFEVATHFTHIFKGIQMKRNCLFKFPFSLWNRASKCRCAKFLTTRNPSSALFLELKGKSNIASCRHRLPPSVAPLGE